MQSQNRTRIWGAGLVLVLAPWLTHCGQGVEFSPGVGAPGFGSALDDSAQTDPDGGIANDGDTGRREPAVTPPPMRPGWMQKSQRVNVYAEGSRDLDVLFVVDNSGSMRSFQTSMSSRIEGFMDHVKDLNYHIAVTSTDPRSGAPWGDGQFRSFDRDRGAQVLRASEVESSKQAERLLGEAIEMGTDGSADERGIYNTYRAIERRASQVTQASFFRDHAALAVVLISDEDECSVGHHQCRGVDPHKSRPDELLKLVEEQFGESKRFVFNSIIFPPGEECRGGAYRGNTYFELSQKTNGVVGSVCAPNYAEQLSSIGQLAKQLVQSVRLECEPQDTNGDSRANLEVFDSDKNPVKQEFDVRGDMVVFAEGLMEGEYLFNYTCKK